MDIIDQMFPPVPEDGTVIGQYLDGEAPWQILQSVHNSSEAEMKEFYETQKFSSFPTDVHVEVEVKKK